MHKKFSVSALAVLFVVAVAGCGAEQQEATAGDPSYVYTEIADIRDAGVFDVLEPLHLADSLPNRDVVVKTDIKEVRGDWSDLVAVGRVSAATADEGVYYPNADPTYVGDDEEAAEIVDFYSPKAHERSIVVTVDAEWTAGDQITEPVKFRIGVPGDADPATFLSGILGMGEVVVLLDQIEDGRHQGEYYPILNGAGFGSIDGTGGLAFKGLGSQEAEFLGEVDTVAELRTEASKPRTTLTY